MEFKDIEYKGFRGVEFEFLGLEAKVIRPNCEPCGKWALKTEYFSAFPSVEIELLNRGWHIAYNKNINRWAEDEDLRRKGEFIKFVSDTFALNPKCSLIGMSCGGLFASKLTSIYPELIDAVYLDAPVLNLLSCPCDMGIAKSGLFEEYNKLTGRSKSDMLSYRDHPIDKMHILLEHDIPVILVAGDSDTVVPYCENGAILEKYYKSNNGRIKVFIKEGCNHHPHGLEDPCIVADILEDWSTK